MIIYGLQIKPLVGPTKAVMNVRVTTFQWHEFFPRGNYEDNNSMFYAIYQN